MILALSVRFVRPERTAGAVLLRPTHSLRYLFDFYQKNIDIPRELSYSPAAGKRFMIRLNSRQ